MKKTNKLSQKQLKLILSVILTVIVLVCGYFLGGKELFGTDSGKTGSGTSVSDASQASGISSENGVSETQIAENGIYTTKEDVALYIHTYGKLPQNFITKAEAERLGWSGGALDKFAEGKCIGGDRFGNYEGTLPKSKGRTYTECDIDTLGARSRGAKRIVFSNDGLIYYTADHYETFELLYGNE